MLIDNDKISNNTLLYKTLKTLVKAKFTPNQLSEFKRILIETPINEGVRDLFFENIKNIKNKNIEDFDNLINHFYYKCSIEESIDYLNIGVNLLYIKNIIIEQSKMKTNLYIERVLGLIDDKLSIAYDFSGIDQPYSLRVIGSILASISVGNNTDNLAELLGANTEDENIIYLTELYNKISTKYNIELFEVFSLIINESINQSINSSAGASYENRIRNVLNTISENVEEHRHDKNKPEIEYDFIYKVDGYRVGISAKRTLRERYKQNWANVDELEVDFMSLITLGIDLNRAKLDTILGTNKTFVIVSEEVYSRNDYMKNNPRVISSVNFNKENISRVISKLSL